MQLSYSRLPDASLDPTSHAIHPANAPAQLVCELAEAGAFSPSMDRPHAPILAAFADGSLHQCRMNGKYDLQRLLSKHAAHLFRSIQRFHIKDGEITWDDLTFRLGPRAFVYADVSRVIAYAESVEEAMRTARQFHDDAVLPEEPRGGRYRLIRTGRDISTQTVPLSPDTVLDEARLELHYGTGFLEWHRDYLRQLRRHRSGLTILEGPPGTGKTSYLRHLMGELTESHRFYFIPNGSLSLLSNPEFVGFWASERRCFEKENFVVVLEDSDAALMARGSDNRDQVSAILNLSDGMLADFLRLQIICTINCRASEIDPALLRPGRLLNHRLFDRLPHDQASRLAGHLGRSLPGPGDYALAEIFAEEIPAPRPRRHIGFTA
jgi:hypothetical protein